MVAGELQSVSEGGLAVMLADLLEMHERNRIAALDADLRGCPEDLAAFTELADTALRHSFEVLRAMSVSAPEFAEDCVRRLFAASWSGSTHPSRTGSHRAGCSGRT